MQDSGIVDVGDGQGLNPLLQYWTMVIHPPMLYLGYVGFTVPFAFAMASLITKQPGEEWIHTTRRWTLVTWFFQSTGILLGAGWAYAVLGWGGYWGWDPVENASLLPWLTATAFLHSVMMQEKKGMMKVWNMVLVAATFFLCIFGTILTRTGIVSSVHAFAQSPIGNYFVSFLAIGIAATILPDPRPARLPEERSAARERGFARIELPVQQPDPAGELLRGPVGHAVPGDLRSGHRREDLGRRAVLQPGEDSDRAVPAVPDRCRSADRVATQFGREPAARVPVADGRCASSLTVVSGGRRHPSLLRADLVRLCLFVAWTIIG